MFTLGLPSLQLAIENRFLSPIMWQLKIFNRNFFSVSHCGLVIYIKEYFKAKEELWKFQYFTMQNYNLQTNLLKETKLLQDITTLSLISSFNTSQNIIFQKSLYKNRPTIWGLKFVKLLYFIVNLNVISLPW